MDTYLTSIVIATCVFRVTGDQIMYFPPEYRSVPSSMRPNTLSLPNSNISPPANHMTRQQIMHTGAMQSHPVPNAEMVPRKNSSYSFNEILRSMNELSQPKEMENFNVRTVTRADDSGNQHSHQSSYGYTRPSYENWAPTTFHEPPSIYTSATSEQDSTNKALPKFNFLEPVTSKMSSKVSGLMGLVLTLLGSNSDNVVMKGFKDVVIDGIVKPLLAAKGGIKVLISKLTIPLISLLLINLEVLVTVWWLWDDCPAPQVAQPYAPSYAPPPYTPPANTYSYNTTYR